ncbi:hypothetical protein C1E24_02415 [Pseudoalteromonas phenolica]|uniref:DUF2799 domain-containing protein n=1 Tax=Pseudoalteromonas phenolica TaxID=161398 RepID=A0A5R9Q6G3_9GAMM|nr:DUF2799 domain-containing protein [Pseudoalteromonas phenolica]TLX48743.1 hypothetical protein C1E24_02415 [Pseudoalteromonas phenolica]
MKRLLICLPLSLLIGCQSNTTQMACNASESEWYEFGQNSAITGKSVRIFDAFKQQCAKQLTPTAQKSYIDGFSDGLISYCTFDNGFKRGQEGLELNQSCPLEIRQEFEKGYKIGKKTRDEKLKQAEFARREQLRSQQKKYVAPQKH